MDFDFGFSPDNSDPPVGTGGIYGGSGTVPTATKATLTDSLTFVSTAATGKFNVLKGIGAVSSASSYSLYAENYISSDLTADEDSFKSIAILNDQSVNNANRIRGGHFIAVWAQTTPGVSLTDNFAIKGVMSSVQMLGAEGTTNMVNYDARSRIALGSTVTNLYGYVFRTNQNVNPSTGTFTNMKGFYMPDLSSSYTGVPAASNRWGLYLEDVSQNYIAGSLGIGITVANARMQIVGTGATSATTSLLVQNSASADNFKVLDDGQVSSLNGYWQGASKILYINSNATTGNLFVGEGSGNATLSGNNNIIVGYQSLMINTTGNSNSSLGYQSLFSNTIGNANVAIGYQSLYTNDSGVSNMAIGHQSLFSNTTGGQNVAIGYQALSTNTSGSGNTVVGYKAMGFNSTASNNTAFGRECLYTNSTGGSNVAIGLQAGYYETGSNKLFIDNTARTNEADGRAKALIYGIFDAATTNQYLNINGNTNTPLAHYNYMAASNSADTIGDVRTYATYVATVSTFFIEKCEVANAAKGGGTWVLINSFAL